MTNETEIYNERARETASDLAGVIYTASSMEAVEEIVYVALKIAYADGVIDELRRKNE